MSRTLTLWLTAAVLAAVLFFATGPPAPVATVPHPASNAGRTIRGAFHIHTTRSDGTLDKREVAAAASRAGLQFAIFTDHGDGTRVPDPPAYISQVLCLDGVEISTNGGHYIGVGLPAAPYRLGGEAEAVAEDVERLGGFGVAAHPFSARPELAWSDWSVPLDALEWLNADSEWRDEGRLRLSRALLDYPWWPAGALASLLDRPVAALALWDQLGATRRVVALAGHDAHGGFGTDSGGAPGRRMRIPSYDALFRTFSLHATLAGPLTADASRDAEALVHALREGRVFTAIEAVAAPPSLDFSATAGGRTESGGGELPIAAGPARFSVRASVPARATTILLRNGRAIAERRGGVLDHDASLPGAYRVEIHLPSSPGTPPVPWLLSNPISRLPPARPSSLYDSPSKTAERVLPLTGNVWRVEAKGGTGEVQVDEESVTLGYQLESGAESSQFVGLATDLQRPPENADLILLVGRAAQPMRVSVQLRFDTEGDARWVRSVYLDQTERVVSLPIERFRPAASLAPRPSLARATSLLFVVDLTNAVPGARGAFTIREVAMGELR